MFTQSESRDELGIGQIRDAFSETLFPGTSVIQTRRVTSCSWPGSIDRASFEATAGGHSRRGWRCGSAESSRCFGGGHTRGLIGRVRGPAVKISASTMYWSALLRYGILTADIAPDQVGADYGADLQAEVDELATRAVGERHPTLPTAPPGFPDQLDGFDLTGEESAWLSERILDTASDTLLAHLLLRGGPPDEDSWAPWADTARMDAGPALQQQLRDAELFSLAMHGAALLNNLQIGERYEKAGCSRIVRPVEEYRGRLESWAQECSEASHQFRNWNRGQLWHRVREANPRIGAVTQSFVDSWIDAVVAGRGRLPRTRRILRRLVAERERRQKKMQSP